MTPSWPWSFVTTRTVIIGCVSVFMRIIAWRIYCFVIQEPSSISFIWVWNNYPLGGVYIFIFPPTIQACKPVPGWRDHNIVICETFEHGLVNKHYHDGSTPRVTYTSECTPVYIICYIYRVLLIHLWQHLFSAASGMRTSSVEWEHHHHELHATTARARHYTCHMTCIRLLCIIHHYYGVCTSGTTGYVYHIPYVISNC
jgi:hypothetical protein